MRHGKGLTVTCDRLYTFTQEIVERQLYGRDLASGNKIRKQNGIYFIDICIDVEKSFLLGGVIIVIFVSRVTRRNEHNVYTRVFTLEERFNLVKKSKPIRCIRIKSNAQGLRDGRLFSIRERAIAGAFGPR